MNPATEIEKRVTAKPALTSLVDIRERLPRLFAASPLRKEFGSASLRVTTLSEGDYSVAIVDGDLLSIRLERKSPADLFGCVGHGRERFETRTGTSRRLLVLRDHRGSVVA